MMKTVSLICLAALLLSGSVHGIIIRHDTGYTGYLARESDYPAVFYLEQRRQRKVCVATLIHPAWAITAAHCLDETPLASHLSDGRPYPVTVAGRDHSIGEIHVHPHYPEAPRDMLPDVDLALLRLTEEADHIRAVPIYRETDEKGQQVKFLGWGFHGFGSGGRYRDDGRFRFAHNTVADAHFRLRFVFDDPQKSGSEALEFEGLPGRGDSGGPALLRDDGAWFIAGVAVGELAHRHAGDDYRQGLYGAEVVYERLSRHQRWIDAVIAGELRSDADYSL